MGYFDKKKDQTAQGDKKEPGRSVIQLQETQGRLRPAECAAKGGEYKNGQCYKPGG